MRRSIWIATKLVSCFCPLPHFWQIVVCLQLFFLAWATERWLAHSDNSWVRAAICCFYFQVPYKKLHPGDLWTAGHWHGVLPERPLQAAHPAPARGCQDCHREDQWPHQPGGGLQVTCCPVSSHWLGWSKKNWVRWWWCTALFVLGSRGMAGEALICVLLSEVTHFTGLGPGLSALRL